MQEDSPTDPPSAARWSLWIDRIHHHRLVQCSTSSTTTGSGYSRSPSRASGRPATSSRPRDLPGPDYEPLTPRR